MSDLPNNIEAERAVIGGCLGSRIAIAPIAPWLKPEMFYSAPMGVIWGALLDLYARGDLPAVQTVAMELRASGKLDRIGGITALLELAAADYLPAQVEYFAARVEKAHVQRALMQTGARITKLAADGSQATADLLGSAQKEIAKIQLRAGDKGAVFVADLTEREYDRLRRSSEGERIGDGVMTGFRDLDEITLGFQDQDLIILAARPSVGKTALAINLAHGIAKRADRDVVFFSLEMSRDQLMQRMEAMHSGIDSMRIRTLRMNDAEATKYVETLSYLNALPIAIDDTPAVSVSYMRSEAYRIQAERGRKLMVFVDYLQLMTTPGESVDNRVQAVAEISRGLKMLAKELDCPVVALSQLSRGVESRTSKVPMLSDLRDSGGIEQDADLVMFIYREEMYDRDTEKRGMAEIHIAKHRNGPVGVIPMRFDAATTSFQTLTYRTPEGY